MGLRRIAVANAVLLSVAVVAAGGCEWDPPPTFTVNSLATGVDAEPGDDVCEVTVGAGDCTLRAAIDEANAQGQETELVVPSGDYSATDLLVSGNVRINWGDHAGMVQVRSLGVAAGGQFLADGIAVFVTGNVRVDGVAALRYSSLAGFGTMVDVRPTGIAYLENTTVESAMSDSAIVNDGLALLQNVTVSLFGPRPYAGIATGASATTVMAATAVLWSDGLGPPGSPGPVCSGSAPVSAGYNSVYDFSCALTGVGDVAGTNPYAGRSVSPAAPHSISFTPVPQGIPYPEVLIDRIPPGSARCGTGIVDDQLGAPRPLDGNGDSTVGCDVGAVERTG